MSKTLFTGCSFTGGYGWDLERNDPRLWTNILHTNNVHLQDTEQVNLGITGGSNSEIFYATVSGLLEHCPKYAFVEWSGFPRYRVLLSVETYHAEQLILHHAKCHDHNLNNISYTEKYLSNIRDRFLSLHHPHADILNIVKYTNTLINLAKTTDTQIFFINGICSWDRNYFDVLENVLPSEYTKYTQAILNCSTRDDDESHTLYKKIHNEYQQAGSIKQEYWLNLYDSMRSKRIDIISEDDHHPGEKSNILYFELFNQALNNKLSS